MTDPTEGIRRTLVEEQQATGPLSRETLEQAYGQVWDTSEMSRDFEAEGFMAPYVVVRRRSDGVRGSLEFQTNIGARFYYNFQEDKR
jgi:hypothetical protein